MKRQKMSKTPFLSLLFTTDGKKCQGRSLKANSIILIEVNVWRNNFLQRTFFGNDNVSPIMISILYKNVTLKFKLGCGALFYYKNGAQINI